MPVSRRAALAFAFLRIPSRQCSPQGVKESILTVALAASCTLAYLPALDNGFISDDFIMLDYVEQWRADFTFLFRIAPDVFRLTSYAVLRVFSMAFGYSFAPLYAFVILVHFANCMLLFRLCRLLGGDFRMAAVAALVFSVIQKGQEAIMWLAAMAYVLGGFCVLAALLAWRRGRYGISCVIFLAGLFSTESTLVLLALVPLTDAWISGRLRWRREYLLLLAPALIFTAVFVATLPNHHMVRDQLYAFGWHAPLVFAKSLFRLVYPGLLAGLAILGIVERRFLIREIRFGLAWMSITLSPFLFLTYQTHVPSRHNYVPAMGLALAMAALIAAACNRRLAAGLIAAVMAGNVAYLWTRKDSQYEMRAAPTTRLLEELRGRPPERILIEDFPLNPWMARMSARHVPGWQPNLIEVNNPTDSCVTCPRFRWIERTGSYQVISPGSRW